MASCHTHATLSGGAAVSAAPTEQTVSSHGIHRFYRIFCRKYSPTDFTDAHRFLGCVFAPNLCTSVQSVGVFVGGYGIPAIPTPPSANPPTEFTEFTEASGRGFSPTDFTDAHRNFWRKRASHRFHRCPQMVRLCRVLWEDSLVAAWVWQGCHTLLICAHL